MPCRRRVPGSARSPTRATACAGIRSVPRVGHRSFRVAGIVGRLTVALRSTALAAEDIEPRLAAKVSSLEVYLGETLESGLLYTGTGAHATEAVPAALLIFAKIPHHTEEAIVTAANAGGDTTAIGIIVGALAEALNGSGSLPRRWLARLEERKHIERLAETLYWMVWGIEGKTP